MIYKLRIIIKKEVVQSRKTVVLLLMIVIISRVGVKVCHRKHQAIRISLDSINK